MVNVNVQLPPVVSAPFPQAAETLQRENQLRPTIPKTEETHAYAKLRDDKEREQAAHQSSQIIQHDTSGSSKQQQGFNHFNQRREHFFATKLKLSSAETEQLSVELSGISDYKQVLSVIQEKYNNAVSPNPEPSVKYSV